MNRLSLLAFGLSLLTAPLCAWQSETEKKPNAQDVLTLSYEFKGTHVRDLSAKSGGEKKDEEKKEKKSSGPKFGPPPGQKFGPPGQKGEDPKEKGQDKKDDSGEWSEPGGWPFVMKGSVKAGEDVLKGLIPEAAGEGTGTDLNAEAVQKFLDLFKKAKVADDYRARGVHKVEGSLKAQAKPATGDTVQVDLAGTIKIHWIVDDKDKANPLWLGGDLTGTLTLDKNSRKITAMELKVEKARAGGTWDWGVWEQWGGKQDLGGTGSIVIKTEK